MNQSPLCATDGCAAACGIRAAGETRVFSAVQGEPSAIRIRLLGTSGMRILHVEAGGRGVAGEYKYRISSEWFKDMITVCIVSRIVKQKDRKGV